MRRSKMLPMRTIFRSRASLVKLSVVGPGMVSARSNVSIFSVWQKYCERNNSWTQTICAPRAAASLMSVSDFARFLVEAGGAGHLDKAHVELLVLHDSIVGESGGELRSLV